MTVESEPSLPVAPVQTGSSEELEEKLEELEFLQRLDRELTRVLSLDHVLDITLDWAMRRTTADTGLIAKKLDNGLQIVRVVGSAYQYAPTLMREPWPLHSGVIGRAAQSGKPVYMAYVTNSSDQNLIYAGSRSQFTVPLALKDEVIGVLHLESRHPAHFTAEMRAFVSHIANRASIAFYNADLFQRTYNAEQLKSDMIRMAAHDLRNPLSTVISAVHLLKRLKSQVPDVAAAAVQSIENAANQMRMLIEELLTLERIESAIQAPDQLSNLVSALQDALARIRPDVESKAHDLIVVCGSKPIMVYGEAAFLRQAMINLISNATKYTPQQGRIKVRLEQIGSRAFFEVQDNGYGISEERQRQIFQRFYRAKEPGTEYIEGTGLGLSLVKTIIKRSEGEVWFTSKAGEGSTFGFWLPVSETAEIEELGDGGKTLEVKETRPQPEAQAEPGKKTSAKPDMKAEAKQSALTAMPKQSHQ